MKNALTKKELRQIVGISEDTLRRDINKVLFPELEKLGYKKTSIVLRGAVLHYVLKYYALE